jgi:hypothetical protein
MLHAGLDLSRKKLDVCLLSDQGEHLDQLVVPPEVDSLRRFARRIEEVHCEPVCAVIESMTGARIAGLQDRQDRLEGPRRPFSSRPGAGDLAARSECPRGA